MIAARRFSACMHGPWPAEAAGRAGRLVDRRPSVSPERLIVQLKPPPAFAAVSFAICSSAKDDSPLRTFCAKSTRWQAFHHRPHRGADYRHRELPPAPEPLPDSQVAALAARVDGATLDDFDALCAHLATMHPSRYLTLIEGVTAVFLAGVHGIDDQNVALRLVALTDQLYNAGIPVVASGAKLDTIFGAEMLAGGFRKKYLRATSRLLALTAGAEARALGP